MKSEPIMIERIFDAPSKKVWKALTDPHEMRKWYFDIPDFKPQLGSEFKFSAGTEQKQYLHLCKITEVDPEKKFGYSWRYDGFPGNSFVTFELFDEGEQTKLKLTHAGLETFPANMPEFSRQNFVTGWTEIIGKMLKDYLEKKAVTP